MRYILLMSTLFSFIKVYDFLTVEDIEGCQKLKYVENTDNADFVIVGLFPVHGHTSTNEFYYNPNGIIWSEAARYFIELINNDDSILKGIKLGFVIYDTCSELKLALPAILNMLDGLVSNENERQPNSSADTCKCVANKTDSYIGIVGDAASSISTAVSNVLSANLVPQVSYSSTSTALSNKQSYPSFARTIPSDFFQVKLIVDMVQYFKWTYISVVSSDDAYGRIGIQQLIPALKNASVCIAVEAIFSTNTSNRENIDVIVGDIKSDMLAKVVVLWAQRPHAMAFMEQATLHSLYDKVWIGTESWAHHNSVLEDLDPRITSGLIAVTPVSGNFPLFKEHFSEVTNTTHEGNPWISEYFALREKLENKTTKNFGEIIDEFSFTKIGYVSDAVYALAYALEDYINMQNMSLENFKGVLNYPDYLKFVRNVTFLGALDVNVTFDGYGDVNDALYYLKKVERNSTGKLAFFTYGTWNSYISKILPFPGRKWHWPGNTTEYPTSKCSDVCQAGYYDIEGGKKCCWQCIACPDGTYKESSGNDKKCINCPISTISNRERTMCLKLSPVYMKAEDPLFLTLLVFGFVGVSSTFFILSVFCRHRKTPVVRSSNYKLSIIQLLSLTLLFMTPLLFIGKPTYTFCILRPSIPGLLLTSIVTITLIKTEYLVRIFSLKSILSSRIVFLSKTLETASICVVCVIQIIYTIGINIYLKTEVIDVISKENVQVIYRCGNDAFQFCAQLMFVLILTLSCLIQAFRARSLPENYNEAKRITYAMLCLSLCLGLNMLFYVNLPNIEQKYTSTCLLFIIGNFILIFWMYSYKVIIILFFKVENTKTKFNTDRMSFVRSEVARKISTRIHPEPSTQLSLKRSRSGTNSSIRSRSSTLSEGAIPNTIHEVSEVESII